MYYNLFPQPPPLFNYLLANIVYASANLVVYKDEISALATDFIKSELSLVKSFSNIPYSHPLPNLYEFPTAHESSAWKVNDPYSKLSTLSSISESKFILEYKLLPIGFV